MQYPFTRLVIPSMILLACCHLAGAGGDLPVTGREEPALGSFDQMMLTFLKEHEIAGGALAVARNGRIVYARGFGYADVEKRQPVEPHSLFRIASISKPFTAAAILQLQERGKLRLADPAFDYLGLTPHIEPGAKVDPRLPQITIANLLHHAGGFDRGVSFDPMFRSLEIARAFGTPPPAMQQQIIEYMMGRSLDFDPGTQMKYSNFGYCVLGRVIEKASGLSYNDYLQKEILEPLGIHHMRLGRTLEHDRAAGEVHYYPIGNRRAISKFGDGRDLPVAYGGWCIEAMDSHGGWLASAPELVRFASAFNDVEHCPILKAPAIAEMFGRPKELHSQKGVADNPVFYACGWNVRPAGKTFNTWHGGLLDGACSELVRRHDGLTWAILFNRDRDKDQKPLINAVDPLVHAAADRVKNWPQGSEFIDREPAAAKY